MSDQVLVLRALGLGDLLTGVPALRALRRGLPEHRITLAAPAALAPLALQTGAVDEVLPASGLAPLRWDGPLDMAVDLHGRGPQSHQLLLPLRPTRLLAFAHPEMPEVTGPGWRPDEHEVDRWCRFVYSYGFHADPAELDMPVPQVPEPPVESAVVIHPGAAAEARRWPVDRFAEVAADLRRRGLPVVVTGNAAERPLAARLVERAELGQEANLAGRTSVLELAALVARARLVICGDTGVGHLATAYRVPSVLLFGPVSPLLWGPPTRPRHVVLWAGRTGDPHGRVPDPGLLSITVDEVLAAALGSLRTEVAA